MKKSIGLRILQGTERIKKKIRKYGGLGLTKEMSKIIGETLPASNPIRGFKGLVHHPLPFVLNPDVQ